MNAFAAQGRWFRCALHAHTTNSDGELAPEYLVRHYDWAGYDVLAITDHWHRTVEASSKGLLVIPSTELNARCPTMHDDAHVLALGLQADPELPEGEFAPLQEVVDWIAGNGGLPFLAHTYWSGLASELWWETEGLLGIEVWNSGCELELGRGDSSLHWDEVLERGRALTALATDDSHHPGYDSGFAWTWVRASERTQDSILAALAAGDFYGSTGPEIHAVDVSEDDVVVRCSPAAAVTLYSGRWRGARANEGRLGYPNNSEVLEQDAEGRLTAVRLRRPYEAPYGRVEVLDRHRRKAWTNALWIA